MRAQGSVPRRVRVTACVCTRDRPEDVRACLEGLARQSVGPDGFEILVVDSFSGPAAAAEVARMTASVPNARLVRLERPGLSVARNAGARAAGGDYVAYLDDDAIPEPDWVEQIERAIERHDPPPTVLGGRILPLWETELPSWWPARLRGVLSIIETEGAGEFRSGDLPVSLEPYGANMAVQRATILAVGGFDERIGRVGGLLLSDEDVQLAWRLQNAGHSVRYDGRITVCHSIRPGRLTPAWLLSRLYWQGASTVLTRRLLGEGRAVRRGLARRLAVCLLLWPAALVPRGSTVLLGARWRLAYSLGFARAALQPRWLGIAGTAPP